jgi:hypothetical protein
MQNEECRLINVSFVIWNDSICIQQSMMQSAIFTLHCADTSDSMAVPCLVAVRELGDVSEDRLLCLDAWLRGGFVNEAQ